MTPEYKKIPIDNILYSCGTRQERSTEDFLGIHVVTYVLSGEMQLTLSGGTRHLKTGTLGLMKRNQLVKAVKLPPAGGEFKAINIFLNTDILRKYSTEHHQHAAGHKKEQGFYELQDDAFVKAFFASLEPYFTQPDRMTPLMTELKTKEVIALVLDINPALKDVLFDFSEPHKIDLEAFMLQNYMFNVSIDTLAKLTGRSRAGFKRDFEKVFQSTPGQWLKQKRLQEAYRLIKDMHIKPSDVYLDVGFENLSHFSLSFKQAFGVSPSTLYR